jgi:DNA polymerase III delta prime subunit
MPHSTSPTWVDRFHALVHILSRPSSDNWSAAGFGAATRRGRGTPPSDAAQDAVDDDTADIEAIADPIDDLLDRLEQKPKARPPVVPTVDLLYAAARLAHGLTAAQTAAMFAPGAVTVIRVGPEHAMAPMDSVITTAVVPRGMTIERSAKARGAKTVFFLRLTSDTSLGLRLFEGNIAEVLALPHPCVILLSDEVTLPPGLAGVLPAPHVLPPIDRAAIRAMIAARFPDLSRRAVAAATRTLPTDDALAALGLPALGLAFRQTSPAKVVACLFRLTAPRRAARSTIAADGPHLDLFDPEQAAVQIAQRALGDLALWRAGKLRWSDVPNGLLVSGPPGTGKTWLARAVAASGGLPLVTGTFGEWQRAHSLGPMLAAMCETFEAAREAAPCVLFIDEIDAVGTRLDRHHNSSYDDKVIAAFLTQVEAIRQVEGVILMGATNRADGIDPAVIRAGRFDHKVTLDRPTLGGLRVMLTGLLKNEGFTPEAITDLARAGLGLSAADIAGALRLARSTARAAKRPLTPDAIREALGGKMQIPPALGWRIAVHEAGHAVVAARHGFSLDRISLGAGDAFVDWRGTRLSGTLDDMRKTITVLLGGRAAEEVLLGDASSGAGGGATSDLAHATTLASGIEARLGLGASGLVWNPTDLSLLLTDTRHRARVEGHLADAHAAAREIVTTLRSLVEALARDLMRERELTGAALAEWCARIGAAGEDMGAGVELRGSDYPDEITLDEDLLRELADVPIG